MKQTQILILILVLLGASIYALKSGFFHGVSDEYSNYKLPDEVDYNFHIKPILSDN